MTTEARNAHHHGPRIGAYWRAALTGGLLLAASALQAGLIVVNTLADEFNNDGDCSLPEAVVTSNTNTFRDQCGAGQILGIDEIFIDLSGTIELENNLLVTQEVTIYGRSRNATTLDAQNLGDIFWVQMGGDGSGDFELRDITVTGGLLNGGGGAVNLRQVGTARFENVLFLNNRSVGVGGLGGAIATALPVDNSAQLVIDRSLFVNNSSGDNGGAVGFALNATNGPPDSLVIRETAFNGNSADGFLGGAVFAVNVPIVVIENSLFRDNTAPSGGGALHLETLPSGFGFNQISASTFLDNAAGTSGGAIQTSDGTTVIRNSTFSGNEANEGAAIAADFDASTAIFHSTLVDNGRAASSTGSVLNSSSGAELSLGHSIVYSAGAGLLPECSGGGGTLTSLGHNIDTSGACTGHASDLPMTDPQLAPLGNYGDDTPFLTLQTFLPLNGPANNGGQNGPCPAGLGATLSVDQRGEPRPTTAGSNRCDIGAVEVQPGSDPTGFPLAVDIDAGSGVVLSSPGGIDCPGDCIGQYLENSNVRLDAIPSPGYRFVGWSGACSGTNTSCQFVITGASAATATFEQSGFTLDAAIDGNASGVIVSLGGDHIDCPGDCSANYPDGTSVDLIATPAPGTQFQNWAGDCAGSGSCTVTMDANRRVTAIFTDGDTLFLDGFE